jgi:ketosteroid isomerase-like protein
MTDDTELDLAWEQGFAAEWVAAWNADDVEAVLAHYDEDVVFSSAVAERFAGRTRIEARTRCASTGRRRCARRPTCASN